MSNKKEKLIHECAEIKASAIWMEIAKYIMLFTNALCLQQKNSTKMSIWE